MCSRLVHEKEIKIVLLSVAGFCMRQQHMLGFEGSLKDMRKFLHLPLIPKDKKESNFDTNLRLSRTNETTNVANIPSTKPWIINESFLCSQISAVFQQHFREKSCKSYNCEKAWKYLSGADIFHIIA
ncbi:CLUMA_CG013696, isoform A [Clunio marinus]|uniref:CLUMA_CG013696, isoform A n=1 Tax=Clunio marinus TaxID=568069 RepID=A0A1J1IMW3_9DIPT|nr:CLUMA_CG013696, isoform A [Clunio marinus]